MRLEERTDNMLGRLIKESRAIIDAVAVGQPRTWADVHAIIVVAKKGGAKIAKGVTSPRAPSRSLKGRKISYLRLGSAVKRASPSKWPFSNTWAETAFRAVQSVTS
jgi:hypothetical protein